MRQPTPETIRSACERPVHALRDPVPPQAVNVQAVTPALNLAVDPFSQQFDMLSRPFAAKSNNWAVWWSDLMMTMFVMFAALYVFQMPKTPTVTIAPDAPAEVRQTPPPAGDSLLARLHQQALDVIRLHGLSAFAAPRLVPDKSVRFVLSGEQLFEAGKARIKPGALTPLRLLSQALVAAPYKITLVGHAAVDDAVTGAPAPWELSTARAGALAEFLASSGLPARKMIVVGYGDQEPVRADASLAEAAVNRRAEIVISAENPTDPLPPDGDSEQAKAGVRRWMTSQGEGTWTQNR